MTAAGADASCPRKDSRFHRARRLGEAPRARLFAGSAPDVRRAADYDERPRNLKRGAVNRLRTSSAPSTAAPVNIRK